MQHRRLASVVAALALAGTCLVAGSTSAQATHTQRTLGTRSLAQVLAKDGHHFDRNWHDFDLVDAFFRRVVEVRPHSPLAIIYHGREPVTAFLPTDGAFRRAAVEIVGRHFRTERGVYRALWRAGGMSGVVNVLSYHLIAGPPLTFQRLAAEAPTTLTTMQGGTLHVRYRHGRVILIDHDPVSPNARIYWLRRNMNEGNRQIGQGVSNLLSPVVG